jgi:hypothetical protein
MRVAVSGTHCSGKSTLVEAFLLEHPEYVHEPEAYEVLSELHGESFSEEPSAEDFFRQLEYQVNRLRTYECDDLVILERSPADYVAYLQALIDLDRESADLRLVGQSIQIAREAFGFLDLVVFLPIRGIQIDVPEEEDRRLRSKVDEVLEGILVHADYGITLESETKIVEAVGALDQRLRILEAAVEKEVRITTR